MNARICPEPSTTLSDPQLMKPPFGLLHPPHVVGTADKQPPREDFLDEGPGLRKRQSGPRAGSQPLGLEKRVGDRTDQHVVLPAGIRAPFEVVEPEFGLGVLIVLLDGPPVMRQPDQRRERGRRGQRDEIVFASAGGADYLYAHLQIDAQVIVRVARGWSLVAYGLNLNNEVFGFYNGSPQYVVQREFYQPTYAVGMRWNPSIR
jgi:hypothetical protein